MTAEQTTTADLLRAEIKKLSVASVQAKMQLHDLSEELPIAWETIPEVAQKTYGIFK